MCRAEGDLEACCNKILTIFDPYTFSHSQGQILPPRPDPEDVPRRRVTLRFLTPLPRQARMGSGAFQFAAIAPPPRTETTSSPSSAGQTLMFSVLTPGNISWQS